MKPARVCPELNRRFTPSSAEGGFVQIIIVAVIALIFGAAAIFGYQKFLKKSAVVSQKTETQSSPMASVDETANWKTYTNQELGFSLKYPSNVTTDFVAYGAGGSNILGIKGPNYVQGEFSSGMAIFARGREGLDVNQLIDNDVKSSGVGMDGKKFTCPKKQVILNNNQGVLCSSLAEDVYYLKSSKTGKILQLITMAYPREGYQSLVTQILSTFKFIN